MGDVVTCVTVADRVYSPGMNVYGTNTNDDRDAANDGMVGNDAPSGMDNTDHCVVITALPLIHGLIVDSDVALNAKLRRWKYEFPGYNDTYGNGCDDLTNDVVRVEFAPSHDITDNDTVYVSAVNVKSKLTIAYVVP